MCSLDEACSFPLGGEIAPEFDRRLRLGVELLESDDDDEEERLRLWRLEWTSCSTIRSSRLIRPLVLFRLCFFTEERDRSVDESD